MDEEAERRQRGGWGVGRRLGWGSLEGGLGDGAEHPRFGGERGDVTDAGGPT